MISFSNMSLGVDKFSFAKTALIISKTYIDLTNETECGGFEISGTEPPGTLRKFIFQVDGEFYKFKNGVPALFDYPVDFESVLENGNDAAQLLAVSSISDWLGKKIYPIIALYAAPGSPVMPKVRLAMKVRSFNDVYTKTDLSPIFELGRRGKISSIDAKSTLNGYATLNFRARLRDGGVWSDFLPLADCKFQPADAVQISAQHILTNLDGRDTSKVERVTINFSNDLDGLAGEVQEIVIKPLTLPDAPDETTGIYDDDPVVTRSQVQAILGGNYTPSQDSVRDSVNSIIKGSYLDTSNDWATTCYSVIRFSNGRDCRVQAYACHFEPLLRRSDLLLGTGNGEATKFLLDDENIIPSTIQLQAGEKNLAEFDFDTTHNTLKVIAPDSQPIRISYTYNSPPENWQEMTKQIDDDGFLRFTYKTNSEDKSVAFKLRITRLSGSVKDLTLGAGNGRKQIFFLEHRALPESIVCSGTWTYNEAQRKLEVQADFDETISISYDWLGEELDIKDFIVGWRV